MDVAENTRAGGQQRAFSVEECVCPPGYRGLSCEVWRLTCCSRLEYTTGDFILRAIFSLNKDYITGSRILMLFTVQLFT